MTSRSGDLIEDDAATCTPFKPGTQKTGDLQHGTKVESSSISSEATVPSPSSRDHKPRSKITVSALSQNELTVPGQLYQGDYTVPLLTSDSGVPSKFQCNELISPGEKSFVQRSMIGSSTIPTPGPCGAHEGVLPSDTWMTRMETLMSRTLNPRLPRPHGHCAQTMSTTSHNPARSVSFGACVRGRCEGLDCMAAPPVSPIPPYKVHSHQDSSMTLIKQSSSPQPQIRCHMRSQSDLPAPHTFSELYNTQKTRLPSVDFCVSQSPVQWNSSLPFSSTRLPVAGSVPGVDRSSPSSVRCPTPSLVSAECNSHPPNAAVDEAARAECVASCVQWIHDQVPPWPTTRTPQPRTLSTVQREAVFKAQIPTTTPHRQAAEASAQWYTDFTGSGHQVRRRDDTVTINNAYSPAPDTRVHCCQGQVLSGIIQHPVSPRAATSSPKFKVKFVKGMTPCVTPESVPQGLKTFPITIPDNVNTIPQECSITF